MMVGLSEAQRAVDLILTKADEIITQKWLDATFMPFVVEDVVLSATMLIQENHL